MLSHGARDTPKFPPRPPVLGRRPVSPGLGAPAAEGLSRSQAGSLQEEQWPPFSPAFTVCFKETATQHRLFDL